MLEQFTKELVTADTKSLENDIASTKVDSICDKEECINDELYNRLKDIKCDDICCTAELSDKVYAAAKAYNEAVELNEKKKMLTLDRETYVKVSDAINACFNNAKDKDSKTVVKKFISAIYGNTDTLDDKRPLDAFNTAAVNKIYKKLYGELYKEDSDMTVKDNLNKKLSLIVEKL